MNIPLSRPDITPTEKERVLEVLNTPQLSLGPKLAEFEGKFAHYIGSRYAVAVNSGTSGLHLCVRALGIKDADEVLTTPFSFVASANCLLFERAKPIFVDIDERTWNMDVDKLGKALKKRKASSNALKGILAVHVFGRPCAIYGMKKLASEYGLRLIEDACEAVGAETRGKQNQPWRKVGTFGDCGVFGFYPNKQMTTGEGGMIVTDNANISKLCRSLRNQGRSENGGWLQHERLGYNYRISDINCALGIVQLERIGEILAQREKVARFYDERLKEIDGLLAAPLEVNKRISWFVYVVRLEDKYSRSQRDEVLARLKEKGIGCSNYFSPIHLQPFYKKTFGYKKGDFPVTEKVSERTLALPFYNRLEEGQVDYVCEQLKRIIQSLPKNHKRRRAQV